MIFRKIVSSQIKLAKNAICTILRNGVEYSADVQQATWDTPTVLADLSRDGGISDYPSKFWMFAILGLFSSNNCRKIKKNHDEENAAWIPYECT